MASAVSPNPVGERTVRNTDYYLQGGDVVFRVCGSVIGYCGSYQ